MLQSHINCKYCQSENVIKYGKYKDVQRYFCKDCKRKFAGIDTIPKMQYPTDQVSDVLNMYYEGMSLKEIRRNFRRGKKRTEQEGTPGSALNGLRCTLTHRH